MSVNSALACFPLFFIDGCYFVHGVDEEIKYVLTNFHNQRGRELVQYGASRMNKTETRERVSYK